MFTTMFGLPSPDDSSRQGTSNQNPIILQDDAEEFRALCWALYALPPEVGSQYDIRKANIPRLISLAQISRKYQLEGIERWCLDLLTTHINPQTPLELLDNCTAEALSKLLELSILTDLKGLEESIKGKWLNRIREGQLDISHALTVAERLNLREFQGLLYYAQLVAISGPLLPPTAGFLDIQSKITPLSLSSDQKIKLCMGAWSLTLMWARALDSIYQIKPEYRHNANCLMSWALICPRLLNRPVVGGTGGDCAGILRRMAKAIETQDTYTTELVQQCSPCRTLALNTVKGELEKLENGMNLADCFLGAQR
ncbi:hypothetical protein AX16_004581 [Volvariella volvacea WC 439]|nr:hypothetical protein AX16_004581 [Volvariella volvacea WC 439]